VYEPLEEKTVDVVTMAFDAESKTHPVVPPMYMHSHQLDVPELPDEPKVTSTAALDASSIVAVNALATLTKIVMTSPRTAPATRLKR